MSGIGRAGEWAGTGGRVGAWDVGLGEWVSGVGRAGTGVWLGGWVGVWVG